MLVVSSSSLFGGLKFRDFYFLVVSVHSMSKDGKNVNLFTVSGFKFIRPLEKHLCYFLKLKILGLELPANAIEQLDDLYSYNPEELPMSKFEQWEKNEAFFFTYRYSESLNGSKNLRDGDWKAFGGDVEILDKRTKSIVGFRRLVVFCWEPELFGMKINWFVHEYRVKPFTISASNGDKEDLVAKMECYVLCKVQAKAVKEGKKIPRMLEDSGPFDWEESDSDSEEEHFVCDNRDDLVTTEWERGKRYKPALSFQDEVALEELFPKFFRQ